MGFEEFGFATHINDQVYRLVRNMRTNAKSYITMANSGIDPVKVGSVMKADADRFLERLATLTSAQARNQGAVARALASIGATVQELNTLKTSLINECTHVKSAALTTAQQCIDEANHILSIVPDFEGLH